jgi:hypothetical protein
MAQLPVASGSVDTRLFISRDHYFEIRSFDSTVLHLPKSTHDDCIPWIEIGENGFPMPSLYYWFRPTFRGSDMVSIG